MKIIITGSLGNISKPLALTLVQKGHAVTVISSKPDKQKDIEALGAVAAIGSLEDVHFLTTTFTGADAVYCMIPPNYFSDHTIDPMEYCLRLANNYAQAIRQSGIKRVLHLSGIGAHLDKGSGMLLPYHFVEGIFAALPGVGISCMRPTGFYNNLYRFTDVIKSTGKIISNYGGDNMVSWVSPLDIATVFAEEIVTPLTGRKVQYVASEDLTCNETAAIIGEAIGLAGLKWEIIPDEQMQHNLEAAGIPPRLAAAIVETNAAIRTGIISADYFRNKPAVMGKVKLKDFAKDFATVYHQQ